MQNNEELYKKFSNAGNFLWYLRPSQMDLISVCAESRQPFLECARRFGKTTSVLVHVMTFLRHHPRTVARWISPWKNQSREIVMPEVDKIQYLCDEDKKAKFVGVDSYYLFPNGSRMYLRGANDDKCQSARGPFAHIIVCDEFGFWNCPEAVESILKPQLLTTKGQLIFASTPSDNLGHSYYNRRDEAKEDGRLVVKTIFDNESLTKEDIDEECENQGGPLSDSWRREYLCEAVSKSDDLVFPEFKEDKHVTIKIDYPLFYDCYVGADLGFNDNTGMLFGFFHFEERTVYIEDELWMRGKNSQEIAKEARNKEEKLWNQKKPLLRVSDNDLQQLYDLNTLHDYVMTPTRKDDKQAAINKVRTMFSENRIRIHERCKNLIFQCKVGMYNATKTSFVRGAKTGHLDLLDALIYMVRNVDQYKNPTPAGALMHYHSHFIVDERKEDHETLKNIFEPKRRYRQGL